MNNQLNLIGKKLWVKKYILISKTIFVICFSGEYEQVDRILEMNTSPDSDIR